MAGGGQLPGADGLGGASAVDLVLTGALGDRGGDLDQELSHGPTPFAGASGGNRCTADAATPWVPDRRTAGRRSLIVRRPAARRHDRLSPCREAQPPTGHGVRAVELRRLRYFVAVAEELNLSRAAERLLIAGHSLSQQITSLERDLGVRLFDRDRRSVSLTPAGSALLLPARDLPAHAAGLRRHAGARSGFGTGTAGLPRTWSGADCGPDSSAPSGSTPSRPVPARIRSTPARCTSPAAASPARPSSTTSTAATPGRQLPQEPGHFAPARSRTTPGRGVVALLDLVRGAAHRRGPCRGASRGDPWPRRLRGN
ncbi:LysR family transcriptional regulator [Streptomyces sp. CoH27]|uniref:LysR family transcriptional regulator n=1 Tax=Streptomyces sp. CoH27 TaxID=2875763 RepID=UPI0027DEC370|nr:LysR family transcriptional regulator [Streptomyces sp. CoH27]